VTKDAGRADSPHGAGLRVLAVQDIRPLPPADPDGISMVFFVVALLAPSVAFGNLLVTRVARTCTRPGSWPG
jgi:hypothetical protein